MIYAKIQALCKAKGTSVAKLEKELGLGNGTIGGWDKSSPTVSRLKLVADYFGVSVDDLLKDSPKEKRGAHE